MSVFCVALAIATSGLAYEGIIHPLYIGNTSPVRDEFGIPMSGSNNPEEAADRCRVEMRLVTDGIIHSPSVNGDAHSANPLVSPDCVGGIGQNASQSDSGFFCMVFPYRLPPGMQFFIRVYNAPSSDQASFYVDSPVTTIPQNGASLKMSFGDAQPIDTRDIDADGLMNSWETALGTDSRFSSDFDGDGISDLDEWLAGTNPADTPPAPVFRSIARNRSPVARTMAGSDTQSVSVSFQAVSGKTYEVQYLSSSLVGAPQEFKTAGTQTADSDECEMSVDIPNELKFIILRLRIVP